MAGLVKNPLQPGSTDQLGTVYCDEASEAEEEGRRGDRDQPQATLLTMVNLAALDFVAVDLTCGVKMVVRLSLAR